MNCKSTALKHLRLIRRNGRCLLFVPFQNFFPGPDYDILMPQNVVVQGFKIFDPMGNAGEIRMD